MSKVKIDKINTEIERTAFGEYIFNHDMARITKITYDLENESWQLTTPAEHVLGGLNHQRVVEILMGHCGFDADTSRVIIAALTIELSAAAQLSRQLERIETEKSQFAAQAQQAASERAQLAGKISEAERIAQELRVQLSELGKRLEIVEAEKAELASKLEGGDAKEEE